MPVEHWQNSARFCGRDGVGIAQRNQLCKDFCELRTRHGYGFINAVSAIAAKIATFSQIYQRIQAGQATGTGLAFCLTGNLPGIAFAQFA